jgi:hypothetical protein
VDNQELCIPYPRTIQGWHVARAAENERPPRCNWSLGGARAPRLRVQVPMTFSVMSSASPLWRPLWRPPLLLKPAEDYPSPARLSHSSIALLCKPSGLVF